MDKDPYVECGTCNRVAVIHLSDSEKEVMKHVTSSSATQRWLDFPISADAGCLSCRLIVGIVKSGTKPGETVQVIRMSTDSEHDLSLELYYIPEGGGSRVKEMLYPFATKKVPWYSIPVHTLTSPESPIWEDSLPLIKSWIQDCDAGHPRSYKRSFPSEGPCIDDALIENGAILPTRVIDVGSNNSTIHLHESLPGEVGRYITLSHCWGSNQDGLHKRFMTTTDNLKLLLQHIPFQELPLTFADAVVLTRALGVRYLWIDTLCIMQNSAEDWANESALMARVFQNAYITFAADWAPHSDAGLWVRDMDDYQPRIRRFSQVDDKGVAHEIFVQRTPVPSWQTRPLNSEDEPVKYPKGLKEVSCYASEATSRLDSRAWVFQEEMLSTRTISFTNSELLWLCPEECVCDCGRYARSDRPGWKSIPRLVEDVRSGTPSTNFGDWAYEWKGMVKKFTSRNLTFETDRLAAMSGVAGFMPFEERDYFAGLWWHNLSEDLMWVNSRGQGGCLLEDCQSVESTDPRHFSSTHPPELDLSCRIKDDYAPTWSWASISAPVEINPKRIFSRFVYDWEIRDIFCTPNTSNPYGTVAKDSHVVIDAWLYPIHIEKIPVNQTFKEEENDAEIKLGDDDLSLDDLGRYHCRGWELCVVREDGKRLGRNATWMDAGLGGGEWCMPGYDYFALQIGVFQSFDVPAVLLIKKEHGSERYSRFGFAYLYNWPGRGRTKSHYEWRVGGERREVKIY